LSGVVKQAGALEIVLGLADISTKAEKAATANGPAFGPITPS
jgi:hypothetical protein